MSEPQQTGNAIPALRRFWILGAAIVGAEALATLLLDSAPALAPWQTVSLHCAVLLLALLPALYFLLPRPTTPAGDGTAPAPRDAALSFSRISLDSATDTIVCVDREGRFVEVNDAFCRASGYSREQLLSMKTFDIDPDITAEFWREFWVKLKHSGSLTFEREHRTREGKTYPVEIVATYFEYSGGEYHIAFARDISARRRAEEEVRLAEERWKLALEGAGHGVFDEDLVTGRFTYSRPHAATLGYTLEEFASLPHWKQRVHPEDLPAVLEARQAHLDGLTPSYFSERRVLCKDGSWKWIQLRGMVVARDAQGKPLRMIGTNTDISARKQAEEEVRVTEERWRLALEGAGHGVFDEDLVTGALTYSRPHAATLGYTLEEFASLPHWKQRVHPEDLPAATAARQAHLDGLTPNYISERRLLCKDGSWKWIHLRGMVVARDAQGKPLRMIGTHTDISARKRAEEEARLADERWRLALEGADHGVWDEDLVTGRISFSRPYVDSLGYTMEEFAGLVSNWTTRLHPDDLDAVMAARQAHLEGITPRYQCERRMRCKDGSWKWIQTRGMVAARDAQGRPLRMIGTHTDISERKKAEAALVASHAHIKALTQRLFTVQEEERLRLARTLHDDLAQTITATACLAQSLSLDLKDRWGPGCEQADRIEQQLSDAVERTRLLAQGMLPLASRVGSISTALNHLARYASETYRIDCRAECEPAEIEQTEEVAEHLFYIAQEGVLNAVKHGQASTVTISLALDAAGSRPRLLVIEDGCGVNEVHRKASRGLGLRFMRQRCQAIGMHLTLGRNPRGGTMLRVE